MSEDILDTCEDNVLTITLNRPDEGNGLNDAGIAHLAALLQGAAARARLVVLKGAGKDFCVGRIAPRGAAAPEARGARGPQGPRRRVQLLQRVSRQPHTRHRGGQRPRARIRLRHRHLRGHHACGGERDLPDAGVRREHHADDRDVGTARQSVGEAADAYRLLHRRTSAPSARSDSDWSATSFPPLRSNRRSGNCARPF